LLVPGCAVSLYKPDTFPETQPVCVQHVCDSAQHFLFYTYHSSATFHFMKHKKKLQVALIKCNIVSLVDIVVS